MNRCIKVCSLIVAIAVSGCSVGHHADEVASVPYGTWCMCYQNSEFVDDKTCTKLGKQFRKLTASVAASYERACENDPMPVDDCSK